MRVKDKLLYPNTEKRLLGEIEQLKAELEQARASNGISLSEARLHGITPEKMNAIAKEITELKAERKRLADDRAIGYMYRIRDGEWLDPADRATAWFWFDSLVKRLREG